MQHFGVCKKRAFGIAMPLPLMLNDKYRQAVRIMKITAFILLVCFLQVSAKSPAQEKITIKEKGASLVKIFTQINKQTGYNFFFTNEDLRDAKPVDIQVKNASLKEVLDLLFKKQNLTYVISDKIITIVSKKNDEPVKDVADLRPPIDIRGKVVDENGKPVTGVTVTIKGTKKQTITDESGEFTIRGVEINSIVAFSAVNMEPFEMGVNGRTEIIARLKTKTGELDEVQIIAYGQTTKRLQTGNVGTVKAIEIENQPVSNPLLALEGRVPGLFIVQSSGLAGGNVTVRIQGQNSIANGNNPLYIIDGVPYTSQVLPSTYAPQLGGAGQETSPFNFINASDIERIEVLKDADATAIYGSRAANGAILITTKQGKAGLSKIDVDIQGGWGKVTRMMNLMNTQEYLEMRHEALKNDGIISPAIDDWDINGLWDTTRYTDWQKELIGHAARYTNVNVSTSGGSSNTQYFIGGTYNKQTTVFPLPSDFADRKGNIHFNLNTISTNKKLLAQLTASYLVDDNRSPITDLTNIATILPPNAPQIYNEDGSLNWMPDATGRFTWNNPMRSKSETYRSKTNNLVSNAMLTYKILPDLDIKSSFGYTNLLSNENLAFPANAVSPDRRASYTRYAVYTNNSISSWIIEPQINYTKKMGASKLDILVGTTIQQDNKNGTNVLGYGYNNDQSLGDIKSAPNLQVRTSFIARYKYNALFGRINYNWNEKYIVNFTCRRDGSSRFGSKNQFHNFGALGVAWVFSKEKFIQNKMPFISFGKLRTSFGTTGSDQINDYQFMNLYDPIGVAVAYQGINSLMVSGLPNPYLEWEETKKLLFGIDLGLIRDKVLFTANYAVNKSSNQLLAYSLPTTAGLTSITSNFPATVQNTSLELAINASIVKNQTFTWTTNLNFTLPKNKLVKFPNLATSTYASSLVIGQPITIQKIYHFVGVNSLTGIYEFQDSHGNVTSTPDYSTDRISLVNTSPKYYAGFESNIQYKGWTLNFLFQFVKQLGSNYSFGYLPGIFDGRSDQGNQPTFVLSRWKKTGDQTNIQRYSSTFDLFNNWYNASGFSDAGWSDASYLRLKNLSISWQIPQVWSTKAHLKSCRIFVRGQNLLTVTNYKGRDPENMSTRSLPPLRVWSFGLHSTL
jgi:TonB-linked SusC/RagA family outer membrane protein